MSWGSSSLSRARASSRASRGAKGVMCQSFRGVGETSPAPEPWLRPSPRAHLTQGTHGSMLMHTHIAAVDAPSARLLYIHGRMGVCSGGRGLETRRRCERALDPASQSIYRTRDSVVCRVTRDPLLYSTSLLLHLHDAAHDWAKGRRTGWGWCPRSSGGPGWCVLRGSPSRGTRQTPHTEHHTGYRRRLHA